VPWTPLYITALPDLGISGSNSSSTAAGSIDSSTSADSCGQWVVLSKDQHEVALPTGCQTLGPGSTNSSASSFIAEGDGGWGLYRTLYTADTRAALRQWVARIPTAAAAARRRLQYAEGRRLAASSVTASNGTGASGTTGTGLSSGLDVQVLLAGSKMLQDLAALALSAFGEVPGAEVWEVLQAAVNASLAASSTNLAHIVQPSSGTGGVQQPAGFGTVLNTLLTPLLPTMDVVLARLAGNRACWLHQQVGCVCGGGRVPRCIADTCADYCKLAPEWGLDRYSLHSDCFSPKGIVQCC
jgi:hypothetical protein